MRRRVISPAADFGASVAALDSPAAEQLVHALLHRIAADPDCAPWVEGMNVRILHANGFDGCPSLVLFYTFDDRAVYPMHVEAGDQSLL